MAIGYVRARRKVRDITSQQVATLNDWFPRVPEHSFTINSVILSYHIIMGKIVV